MISPGRAETLTERDCQVAIFTYRSNISVNPVIIPNIYFFPMWESDMLYVTKSGYLHEFEIKLSLSDFRADGRKEYKHMMLADGRGPSEFWYVCPPGIIPIEQVPDYAGLAYVIDDPRKYHEGQRTLDVQRKAKRQKQPRKISTRDWESLANKATNRYWDFVINARLNAQPHRQAVSA